MDTKTDLRTLTDPQLAEHLVASVTELGDQRTTDTLTVDGIINEVEQGWAVIVAERDAIAVVRPEGEGDPVLWLLFVNSNGRGNGIGKAFVLDLRRRFEHSKPMALVCHGARRESFFASCGFRLNGERLKDGSAAMIAELPNQAKETS